MRTLKIYFWIGLYMFTPIVITLIAAAIANATGSRLDEAGPHPCVILGVDIGGLLCVMGMSFWLFFFTFPTGLLAIAFVILFRAFQRRKAARHDA